MTGNRNQVAEHEQTRLDTRGVFGFSMLMETSRRRLSGSVLLAFALCARLAVSAACAAEAKWDVDLDGVPNFCFSGEKTCLFLAVRGREESPDSRSSRAKVKRELEPQALAVRLASSRGWSKEAAVVASPYSDTPAGAVFLLAAGELREGDTLTASLRAAPKAGADAAGQSEASPVKEMLLGGASVRPAGLHLFLGKLYDKQNRRVLSLVGKRDTEKCRRWQPVKEAAGRVLERPGLLLLGSRYGDGGYAEAFAAAAKRAGRAAPTLRLSDTSRGGALALYLDALDLRAELSGAAVLFPGDDDLALATPTEDYYLALHAAAEAVERRAAPGTRLELALPAVRPGGGKRALAYAETARRVARERGWAAVEIGGAIRDDDAGRYPEPAAQKRIGELLFGAARGGWSEAAPFLGALGVFLLGSFGLLWLRLRSRYRVVGKASGPSPARTS